MNIWDLSATEDDADNIFLSQRFILMMLMIPNEKT